jgi:hypothetical protein
MTGSPDRVPRRNSVSELTHDELLGAPEDEARLSVNLRTYATSASWAVAGEFYVIDLTHYYIMRVGRRPFSGRFSSII